MVDQLHELELSVGPFGVCDILERPTQFLDGNVLLGDTVIGSTAKMETNSHKWFRNLQTFWDEYTLLLCKYLLFAQLHLIRPKPPKSV